jgi:hypothetical protein
MSVEPNTGLQLKDYFTVGLSSLSLLLASYSLYLQRRDKRPRLLVQLEPGTSTKQLSGNRFAGWEYAQRSAITVVLLNRSENDVIGCRVLFKPSIGRILSLSESSCNVSKATKKNAGTYPLDEFVKAGGDPKSWFQTWGRFVAKDATGRTVGRSRMYRWKDSPPKHYHAGGISDE